MTLGRNKIWAILVALLGVLPRGRTNEAQQDVPLELFIFTAISTQNISYQTNHDWAGLYAT